MTEPACPTCRDTGYFRSPGGEASLLIRCRACACETCDGRGFLAVDDSEGVTMKTCGECQGRGRR